MWALAMRERPSFVDGGGAKENRICRTPRKRSYMLGRQARPRNLISPIAVIFRVDLRSTVFFDGS